TRRFAVHRCTSSGTSAIAIHPSVAFRPRSSGWRQPGGERCIVAEGLVAIAVARVSRVGGARGAGKDRVARPLEGLEDYGGLRGPVRLPSRGGKSKRGMPMPRLLWKNLRTSSVIESPFATVRLRQRVTRGRGLA